ncbi:hypothetical protein AAFN47_25740 [Hoeflea sp. CAU 1731]
MIDAAKKARVEQFMQAWSHRLRFAIEGPEGRFSTPWAVWGHKDTVYIASRKLGGSMKVSLHPEGGYRYAFTKQYHPKIEGRSSKLEKRDIVVWDKPDMSDKITAMVACVYFPTDFLRSAAPPSSPKRKYLILHVPKSGWTARVGFFLSYQPIEILAPALKLIGLLCGHWELSDGSSISMVASDMSFDPSVLPSGQNGAFTPLNKSGVMDPANYDANLTAVMCNDPGPGEYLQMVEVGGVRIKPRERSE